MTEEITTAIVTEIAVKYAEKAFEGLPSLVSNFFQPSGWDNWMRVRGNQRVEEFKQALIPFETRQPTISENEKLSRGSGYNKTFFEYVTTPLEEKVELLRNALLNGLYGDYSLELREDLYKIVASLQPLDLHILKYLVSACPSHHDYRQIYSEVDQKKEKISKDKSEGKITQEEHTRLLKEADDLRQKIEDRLFFSTIKENFASHPEAVICRSVDRLQEAGLVYNNGPNRWGLYHPYCGFVPLDLASIFLSFVAEPRNSIVKHR